MLVRNHLSILLDKRESILGKNQRHCRCISSMRSIVYHPQLVAVYHQAAGACTFGDDICLTAMIYTLKRDEMPSLRLG